MDTIIQAITTFGTDFGDTINSLRLRIHPLYMMAFIATAAGLYALRSKNGTSFWRWLFPREIYFHPSHMVDIQLFLVGRVLIAAKLIMGIVAPVTIAMITIALLTKWVGPSNASDTPLSVLGVFLITLVITIADDFCVYWVHRMHHQNSIIWPFHAVHHSAEIMTPVTVYRKHPLYDIISVTCANFMRGIIQGIIVYSVTKDMHLALLGGANVIIVFFNIFAGNFRHSHIWISFGKFWEHIFISPAQHQIHHSINPLHFNKNYGETFAIWDWMFGTLYIPDGVEQLEFGLANSKGERIKQPYPNLAAALINPIKDSGRAIKRAIKRELQGNTKKIKPSQQGDS